MASSKLKKTKTKKIKKIKVKKVEVEKTDIKKSIVENLLRQKQLEIQKRTDLVRKIRNSLQIESKKISELEGAILALHELLTGEKVK